jgi:hypothetical protein
MYLVGMKDTHPDSLPGHAFIGFIGPDGKPMAHGFYPDREKFGLWDMLVENDNMSGYIRNDTDLFEQALSGNSHFAMKVFNVDETTYNNAVNYIQRYAGSNDYGLLSNNCVTAAFSTLTNANLIQVNFHPTPRTIFHQIKMGY